MKIKGINSKIVILTFVLLFFGLSSHKFLSVKFDDKKNVDISADVSSQRATRPVVRNITLNPLVSMDGGTGAENQVSKDYQSLLAEVTALMERGEIDKALDLLESLSDSHHQQLLREVIANKWFELNRTACLEWILNFEDEGQKNNLIKTAIFAASQINIESALEIVDSLPGGSVKSSAVMSLVMCLHSCKNDDEIKSYTDAIISRSKYLNDSGSLNYVARSLASIAAQKGDLESINIILSKMPYGSLRDSFVTNVVSNLAENEPEKAMKIYSENATRSNQDITSAIYLAKSYAKNNALKGIEEAEKLTNPKLKNEFLSRLGSSWAAEKPDKATEWLSNAIQESDFETNRQIGEGVIQGLLKISEKDALTYIHSIPDLAARDSATLYASAVISVQNPESAIKILVPYLQNNSIDTQEAIQRVTRNWSYNDPESTAIWIQTIPPGTLRDIAEKQFSKNRR